MFSKYMLEDIKKNYKYNFKLEKALNRSLLHYLVKGAKQANQILNKNIESIYPDIMSSSLDRSTVFVYTHFKKIKSDILTCAFYQKY